MASELQAYDVVGDVAYTAGLEHTSCSVDGSRLDEIPEGGVIEAIPGQIVQPRALAVLGVQPMKTCHRFTLRGAR